MRRIRPEWLMLLFCLLLATAMPAIAALSFGRYPMGTETLSDDSRLTFYRHEGEDCVLTLRELLTGTIAAYNSSDQPAESLKAQAVALRSRACCLMGYCRGTNTRSLCDSPSHGLMYATVGELASIWGSAEASARLAAAEEAVNATADQVLYWEGDYILALTHTSSPGQTKGMEGYPYLTSVTTPESGIVSRVTMKKSEFAEIAAASFGIACPEGEDWQIYLTCTEAGRVEQVKIGDREAKGVAFAAAMGLPSDAFTITVDDTAVYFDCKGAGSGYGLSREGAALYSSQGLGYREILLHYFPDTTLGVLS